MIIYYFLFVLILICGQINKVHEPNKYEQIYKPKTVLDNLLDFVYGKYVIVAIALVYLGAFRDLYVGLDNSMYFTYFSAISSSVKNNWALFGFEYGYRALNVVIAKLGLGYNALQLVTTLLVIYAFWRIINKYSKDKSISWILFLALGIYAQTFNIVRQMCALAFVLLGLIRLNDKKYIKFIFFVLFACLFHKSAILTLVFIPLSLIPLNTITISIYGLLSVGMSILFIPTLKFINKVFNVNLFWYVISEVEEFHTLASTTDVLFTIGLLFVFVLLFYAKKHLITSDNKKENSLYLSLFFVVPLVRMLGAYIMYPSLAQRVTPYFFFSILILVPTYLQAIKRYDYKYYRIARNGVIILALVYMFFLYAVKVSNGVMPYEFDIFS